MSPNPYENVNIYSRNQNAAFVPTSNSRETDSYALLMCAGKLESIKRLMEQDAKSKENIKLYGDVIRQNQRLWTIFQIALVDPDNPLPSDLKANLLGLSRYIDKTSFRAVGKYRPDLLDSLININKTIAIGLSKTPPEQQGQTVTIDASSVPISLTTSA